MNQGKGGGSSTVKVDQGVDQENNCSGQCTNGEDNSVLRISLDQGEGAKYDKVYVVAQQIDQENNDAPESTEESTASGTETEGNVETQDAQADEGSDESGDNSGEEGGSGGEE